MSMFPYDIAELADGPIRCMFAPVAATKPATLKDIFAQSTPYAPAGTGANKWVDFGATAGPWTHSRNLTTAAYNIQQTTQAVRERVTEVIRTSQVNIAEIRPDIMAMVEESTGVDDVAGATGSGAHSKVPVGNIEDLTQYRMAFIGRRGKDQGVVTEAGTTRGRHFGFVAYRAQLSADNFQLGLAEGDLGNANVTFRLYPEPGEASGEEHGFWIFEDSGTLT
jgi:hypothetical protein